MTYSGSHSDLGPKQGLELDIQNLCPEPSYFPGMPPSNPFLLGFNLLLLPDSS